METYNDYQDFLASIKADAIELLKDADNDKELAIDNAYTYADGTEYVIYYYKAEQLCNVVLQHDAEKYDNAERDMFETLVTDKTTTMRQLFSFIAFHIIRDLMIEAIEELTQ